MYSFWLSSKDICNFLVCIIYYPTILDWNRGFQVDPNVSDICKWIQLLEKFQSPRTLGLIPHIGVVCGFYLSILSKFQGSCENSVWFVFSTWSYLLTWPKISEHAPDLPVVCGFYLFILAYLDPNFRVHAKNLCGLCFLLDLTCLLGQKFLDMHEICL